MIRATSEAWEWMLLGFVWVTASIVLQVSLPWKQKPSYGLFALLILACFVLSVALTEIVVSRVGIESGSTSEELVLAVVMAVFAVAVLVFAEELFFPRNVVFGWRQRPNIFVEMGFTIALVSAIYAVNRLADSWSLRIQIISLYMAMMVALAILWLPKGRWSPRFAPLVMFFSADLLLTSVFDVPQLLALPGGSRHGFSSNSAVSHRVRSPGC
ncbi:MAG: hypothetical protein R3A46_09790 [Thermomicrobiales bacterium]